MDTDGTPCSLADQNLEIGKKIYKPLEEGQIRVLILHPGNRDDLVHCSLDVVSMSKNPDYEAISYVWGEQRDPQEICLESNPYKVTKNLFSHLVWLRDVEVAKTLWIDALAINQSDLGERKSQVQLMKAIYQQASVVLACLDPSDSSFGIWLHLMDKRKALSRQLWPGPRTISLNQVTRQSRSNDKALETAVMEASLNQYFTRTWVVQEVIVSRKCVIRWRDRLVFFKEFQDSYLVARNSKLEKTGEFPGRIGLLEVEASLYTRGCPTSFWVQAKYGTTCQDKRDHIYGLLALFPQNLSGRIPVDYSISWMEVWKSATEEIIRRTESPFIIMMGHGCRIRRPTWVPNYDSLAQFNPVTDFYVWRSFGVTSREGFDGEAFWNFDIFHNHSVLEVSGYIIGELSQRSFLPDEIDMFIKSDRDSAKSAFLDFAGRVTSSRRRRSKVGEKVLNKMHCYRDRVFHFMPFDHFISYFSPELQKHGTLGISAEKLFLCESQKLAAENEQLARKFKVALILGCGLIALLEEDSPPGTYKYICTAYIFEVLGGITAEDNGSIRTGARERIIKAIQEELQFIRLI